MAAMPGSGQSGLTPGLSPGRQAACCTSTRSQEMACMPLPLPWSWQSMSGIARKVRIQASRRIGIGTA
ncbi:hypothetical protein APY03_3158 [Variovorax sp. WDL1]|nr:hypothetical protein APY03_3158 [Variovorax sp. WDL1]